MGHGRQSVAGSGNVEQRFHPACDGGGRDDQIRGAIEELAGAQAGEAPQLALFEIAQLDALEERLAQLGFGAYGQ